MYKDDHSVEALYGNMDLKTPEAMALQKLEDEDYTPPAVDTVCYNLDIYLHNNIAQA